MNHVAHIIIQFLYFQRMPGKFDRGNPFIQIFKIFLYQFIDGTVPVTNQYCFALKLWDHMKLKIASFIGNLLKYV